MSDNTAYELNREFSKLFTALSSRVEVFQTTQKDFLEGLSPQIKEVLPDLDQDDTEVTSAIYGICITDDALKGYEANQFAKDVNYLRSLLPEAEENIVKEEEVTEIESKGDEDPKFDAEGRPILRPPPSKERMDPMGRVSLSERAASAQSNESVYMKMLTAYYQANAFIDKSMVGIQNDIILHHVNARPEIIIASLIIRQHFLDMYDSVLDIYENVPIDVDLRFVTAQIKVAFERVLSPKGTLKSQYEYFEEIKEVYPLGHGRDLFWDLSEQTLFSEYYPKLLEMLQPQIEEAIQERDAARQTMLNNMERAKMQPQQGSTDSIRSKVDSLIFETLHFNRSFDDNSRAKMQRAVESVLKRMALKEYGKQDIPEMEKFIEYFNKEFFKPIFDEYPQLYLPFIDIRFYAEFVEDPKEHVNRHQEFILNQFWFNMRKHGAKDRPNPHQLSHAFSMVIFDVLNNDKVRNFDY